MKKNSGHGYTVSGLTVHSELALPELLPHAFESPPDLEIRFAGVPESLPHPARPMPEAQVTPGLTLLTIPRVGRFLAIDGRRIEIEAAPGAADADLRLFLLGSALGAIHLQRGLFPLHASVVTINGAAVAFAGDSGAGKSTMAAWLNERGHPLLCDDVCVIETSENNPPRTYPAFPHMKLWKDALHALNTDSRGLRADYLRAEKYHLPVPGSFEESAIPLRHVCFLRFAGDDTAPSMEAIPPARAVPLLRDNTYRYQFISGMGLTEQHFRNCAEIANRVTSHYLDRPRNLSALDACRRLVEERFA